MAAGLGVSRFAAPNIQGVAGGIALVQAGGGVAREYTSGRRSLFGTFMPLTRREEKPDLRFWRRPTAVVTPQAAARMCD